MAKVKVGVVGCGAMGSLHIQKAIESKEAKVLGIYDADQTRAQEIAAKYSVALSPTLDSLLSNVEALIIASPTPTHFEIAEKALKSGKHILVEKPLTTESSSAEKLAALAGSKNLALAVGMIERFNPAFVKAASLIKREKILGIIAKRHSPFYERVADISVVWDMMIHDLDIVLSLSKHKIDSLKAEGKTIKSKPLDEVNSTLYFKDGMVANIYCNRAKNDKLRSMQITTDKAIYEVDFLAKKLFKRDFESLSSKTEIEVKDADQITAEQKDFFKSITLKRVPKCPAEEAVAVMKIAEEVEQKCSYR